MAALERMIAPDSGAAEVGYPARATQAGLLELSLRCLQRLGPSLQAERQVAPLVTALTELDLSIRLAPGLLEAGQTLIHSGLERVLWLLEGLAGDRRDWWRRWPACPIFGVVIPLRGGEPCWSAWLLRLPWP